MFALDLFNTDHERRLAEGAVDQLEQRRIDDLAMRMDDLVARAKKADTPEARAALVKEFQKCKDERDSYFKIKDQGVAEGGDADRYYDKQEPGWRDTPDEWADKQEVETDVDEAMFPGSAIGDKLRGMKQSVGRTAGDALKGAMVVAPAAGAGASAGAAMGAAGSSALFAPALGAGALGGAAAALGGFLTYKGLNWLAQKLFGTKEEALAFADAHLKAAGAGRPQFEFQGKTYPVKITNPQEAQQLLGKIHNLQDQLSETEQQKGPRPEDIPAYLRKQQGRAPLTPDQVKAPTPGTISHPDVLRKNRGNPDQIEEQDEAMAQQELGDGYGVYKELLKAWNEKKPYVKIPMPGGEMLTISRTQIFNVLYALKNMNDNAFKKTIATAFSNLDKFMIWSNSIKRYNLPPEKPVSPPGQMKLFKEAGQKKNSDEIDAPQNPAVQRYLTKVRQANPNATSDIEAIAKDELEKQASVSQHIDDLEQVNSRQDAALKKAINLDAQQSNELDSIEKDIDQLSNKIQSIKTAKPSAPQYTMAQPSRSSTNQAPATSTQPAASAQPAQPAVPSDAPQTIIVAQPEKLSQKDQAVYAKVKELETELNTKIDSMAKWNQAAQTDNKSRNELEALRKDMERTKREMAQQIKQLQKSGVDVQQSPQADLDFIGGTPSSRNYISSLKNQIKFDNDKPGNLSVDQVNPDQIGSLERTMAEGQLGEARLTVGDPVVVTAPNEFEGKTGEIYDFSPSGTFVIVDLYNHGKHSMHLSDIEYNDYADQEDDWYDEGVAEGFQDFNRVEPYAVCLAGKPVKKFDYYEDARRFHDNWKKKLYAQGEKAKADKITLMPLNLDEEEQKPGFGEFPPKQEITIVPPKKLKSGETYQDRNKYWQSQGQAPIYKTNEAGSPAQQAAIAIAMKKAGKKPKHMDEAKNSYTVVFVDPHAVPKVVGKFNSVVEAKQLIRDSFNDMYDTGDHLRNVAPGIYVLEEDYRNTGKRATAKNYKHFYHWIIQTSQGVTEDIGSWIVYDPKTKQIKKRFKTHTAGKSYARTHGLGFASSEFYFDRVKDKGVAEGSNPWGPQGRFVGDTGPTQVSTTVARHVFKPGEQVTYKPTEQRATIEALSKDGTQARIHVASGMGGRYFNCKVVDLKPLGRGVAEVAPPGAKAERMVKHIKKSLSKDGKLSNKDKAIAYATTWKAHNAGKVEEARPEDLPGIDYDRPGDRPRKQSSGEHNPYPYSPEEDDNYFRSIFRKKREAAAKAKAQGGALKEFAPGQGGGGGNYFQALASAWYNGTFNTGSLGKGIKSQQDVERLLQRGILCPDGVTRKFGIDYNSDFDGVVISSDDYYEHADYNDQGQEVDSRTGQKWGPYDYMEFDDSELDESLNELSTEKLAQYKTAAALDAGAADRAGNFERGDKRFSGIVRATKKQFANDLKKHKPVAETPTDYQKRRQRERDVDAGRPVKPLPKNPQTDYARKRAKDRKDMELGEATPNRSGHNTLRDKEDYLDKRDHLQQQLNLPGLTKQDRDYIRQRLLDLEFAARKAGLNEESSTSSDAVERAILNRIMVANTDLLMKFGPEKVMQAAEEVAYNVGDVDEIGTSDVSAYVNQVRQILGVEA